ncbi:MAG: DUF1801 domain-containing protein [Xanthomonadales bacterium]|nr:DUF1801 domain-containing protein [Xanthomonadales bacterium]
MADAPKTLPTEVDPKDFLAAVEHPRRRADGERLLQLMGQITGEPARMWGPSIVGFGSYHYVYDSGREGDWPVTGFSPRKSSLVVYIMAGFSRYDELMGRLGKHKTGSSCLYINKLADVDEAVLAELISESVAWIRSKYTRSS